MNQTPQQTRPQLSLGTLHALRLGAQTLDDLASLVNWGNTKDFAATSLLPWVEIEPTQGNFNSESAKDSSPTPTNDKPVDPAETEKPLQDVTPDGEHDIVSDDPPISSTLTSETIATQSESSSSTEEWNREGETLDEPAEDLPTEDFISRQVTNNEIEADQSVYDPVTSNAQRETVEIVEPNQSVAHDAMQSVAAPTNRPHGQAGSKGNQAMSMTKAKSKNDGSNEYLRRLETLVLGLNAQLAQQAQMDTAQPQNELTWLRQRVIDLSLENLELQEQLKARKS